MPDITASVVLLGNPADDYSDSDTRGWTYAKNPWDMQVFDGRLYIGSGNSSNSSAPNSNAGSTTGTIDGVPVCVYEPGVGFVREGYGVSTVLVVEQIERFCQIGSNLIVPSHDPTSTNNLGWFSSSGNGVWSPFSVAPTDAIHTFWLHDFGGEWFAGSGAYPHLYKSTNSGSSWSNCTALDSRSWACFELDGVFYATNSIDFTTNSIWAYAGSGTTFTRQSNTGHNQIFPGKTHASSIMARITNYPDGTSIVYIGGPNVNDLQYDSFGMFRLSTIGGTATEIVNPTNSTAIPYDLLVVGSNLWSLWTYTASGDTVVSVCSQSSLTGSLTEQFTFIPNNISASGYTPAQTFARSFELLDNVWYFGLGSKHTGTQPGNVGDILAYEPTLPPPSGTVVSASVPGTFTLGDIDVSAAPE